MEWAYVLKLRAAVQREAPFEERNLGSTPEQPHHAEEMLLEAAHTAHPSLWGPWGSQGLHEIPDRRRHLAAGAGKRDCDSPVRP